MGEALMDWFDQKTPCPECGHRCFDHASCREDPECECSHRCHWEVCDTPVDSAPRDLSFRTDDSALSGSRAVPDPSLSSRSEAAYAAGVSDIYAAWFRPMSANYAELDRPVACAHASTSGQFHAGRPPTVQRGSGKPTERILQASTAFRVTPSLSATSTVPMGSHSMRFTVGKVLTDVQGCRYNTYMENTTDTNTTTCQHDGELTVSSGVVRCNGCLEWLEDHPDSDHRPGLVEANQWR